MGRPEKDLQGSVVGTFNVGARVPGVAKHARYVRTCTVCGSITTPATRYITTPCKPCKAIAEHNALNKQDVLAVTNQGTKHVSRLQLHKTLIASPESQFYCGGSFARLTVNEKHLEFCENGVSNSYPLRYQER